MVFTSYLRKELLFRRKSLWMKLTSFLMRYYALWAVAVKNSWILLYCTLFLPFPIGEHHLRKHGMQNYIFWSVLELFKTTKVSRILKNRLTSHKYRSLLIDFLIDLERLQITNIFFIGKWIWVWWIESILIPRSLWHCYSLIQTLIYIGLELLWCLWI